jgi:hypothetical protein
MIGASLDAVLAGAGMWAVGVPMAYGAGLLRGRRAAEAPDALAPTRG